MEHSDHCSSAPAYFLCPISLQIMEDPVTVSTGITYERESIRHWIFDLGKNTCPATMQQLQSSDLTPNHTLKRLIQDWTRTQNQKSKPSPKEEDLNKTSLDPAMARKILSELNEIWCISLQLEALTKLRSDISSESDAELCLQLGALDTVVSCMDSNLSDMESGCYEAAMVAEESLHLLSILLLDHGRTEAEAAAAPSISNFPTKKFLNPVSWVLQRGTSAARIHAVMILKLVLGKYRESLENYADQELIEGLLQLLTDDVSHKATSAALEVLSCLCSSSRLKMTTAVEAGAVHRVIELLAEAQRDSICEKLLCFLWILCGCPEGRSAMGEHAMGVAVVSKRLLRVNHGATEMGIRILWRLCKHSTCCKKLLMEMAQLALWPSSVWFCSWRSIRGPAPRPARFSEPMAISGDPAAVFLGTCFILPSDRLYF